MNSTFETLFRHGSVRSYQEKPIEPELLEMLVKAVQYSPSSINGQQVSLVITQAKEQRQKISQIAKGMKWIVEAPVFITLVGDFYKTQVAHHMHNRQQVVQKTAEGLLVMAVDVGIILGNLVTAAESLGLGTVPIGAIRNDPKAMVKLLKLPQNSFPIVGLCIGYPAVPATVKNRLPLRSFVHYETYDDSHFKEDFTAYDALMVEFMKQVNHPEEGWTHKVSRFYETPHVPNIGNILKKQGFDFT